MGGGSHRNWKRWQVPQCLSLSLTCVRPDADLGLLTSRAARVPCLQLEAPTSVTAAAGVVLPPQFLEPRPSLLLPPIARPVGGVGAVSQGPGMWEMRQGRESGVWEWGVCVPLELLSGPGSWHQEW